MGACSAVGCSNSLKKGFALYRFPQGDRNRARRRVWEVRTKRDKWKACDNSRLCEVHFESDQFEPLRKGPKKLKCTAVPTLFLHCADKKKRKPPKIRKVDSTPTTFPADSVLVAASSQGCPSHQMDSSLLTPPSDSVLVAASYQRCPSEQTDSRPATSPDTVLMAASCQRCPSEQTDSRPATSPDTVLMAASCQRCPSEQVNFFAIYSSISCLVAAYTD
ncbi:THAP domain-containing protein 5-like [Rhipicephalus sanguineus]|uniref:THAP domain-containing protein 5-like n=1 Tax=Rhipicephalus sanguineus TaxID=34632 RepID=UPI0020C39B10|nr:THAP domain-containing protein 5-like [Rhipicephalus sanguineus]